MDEADAQNLRDITAMHQSLGVNATLLSPDELKEIVPAVKAGDAALAAYEPDGGFAGPALTVAAYAARAQELSASFQFNTSVVSAESNSTGWQVALSSGETVSAGQVVLLHRQLVQADWGRCSGSTCR